MRLTLPLNGSRSNQSSSIPAAEGFIEESYA
jgi:hypothetical protein